jgi:hypothetical protein
MPVPFCSFHLQGGALNVPAMFGKKSMAPSEKPLRVIRTGTVDDFLRAQ